MSPADARLRKAIWVQHHRLGGSRVVDDLLADLSERAIFDLFVDARGLAEPVLAHLVRGGAAVGVRLHLSASPSEGAELAPLLERHRVEGVLYRVSGGADSTEEVVREATARVRAARPGLVVSAAIQAIQASNSGERRAPGRWPAWLTSGLVDVICALVWTADPEDARARLRTARAEATGAELWAGLLEHDDDAGLLRAQAAAAREEGCAGVLLFGHDPARPAMLDTLAAT